MSLETSQSGTPQVTPFTREGLSVSMQLESSDRRTQEPMLLELAHSVQSMLHKEPPPPLQPAMGFFTDTSLCIGCKACEVACKQWNQLPARDPVWTGSSYDNTGQLSSITWRHVLFIEQVGRRDGRDTLRPEIEEQIAQARSDGTIPLTPPGTALPFFNTDRWLMMSDLSTHCAPAPWQ